MTLIVQLVVVVYSSCEPYSVTIEVELSCIQDTFDEIYATASTIAINIGLFVTNAMGHKPL